MKSLFILTLGVLISVCPLYARVDARRIRHEAELSLPEKNLTVKATIDTKRNDGSYVTVTFRKGDKVVKTQKLKVADWVPGLEADVQYARSISSLECIQDEIVIWIDGETYKVELPAAESRGVKLSPQSAVTGRYCPEDYQKYPAYRRLIDEALKREQEAPPMLAYLLQEDAHVICVFADALGRFLYRAECYRLVDADHFQKLGVSFYSNRSDFTDPELRNGKLHVQSKGSQSCLVFDINKNARYAEDVEIEDDEE